MPLSRTPLAPRSAAAAPSSGSVVRGRYSHSPSLAEQKAQQQQQQHKEQRYGEEGEEAHSDSSSKENSNTMISGGLPPVSKGGISKLAQSNASYAAEEMKKPEKKSKSSRRKSSLRRRVSFSTQQDVRHFSIDVNPLGGGSVTEKLNLRGNVLNNNSNSDTSAAAAAAASGTSAAASPSPMTGNTAFGAEPGDDSSSQFGILRRTSSAPGSGYHAADHGSADGDDSDTSSRVSNHLIHAAGGILKTGTRSSIAGLRDDVYVDTTVQLPPPNPGEVDSSTDKSNSSADMDMTEGVNMTVGENTRNWIDGIVAGAGGSTSHDLVEFSPSSSANVSVSDPHELSDLFQSFGSQGGDKPAQTARKPQRVEDKDVDEANEDSYDDDMHSVSDHDMSMSIAIDQYTGRTDGSAVSGDVGATLAAVLENVGRDLHEEHQENEDEASLHVPNFAEADLAALNDTPRHTQASSGSITPSLHDLSLLNTTRGNTGMLTAGPFLAGAPNFDDDDLFGNEGDDPHDITTHQMTPSKFLKSKARSETYTTGQSLTPRRDLSRRASAIEEAISAAEREQALIHRRHQQDALQASLDSLSHSGRLQQGETAGLSWSGILSASAAHHASHETGGVSAGTLHVRDLAGSSMLDGLTQEQRTLAENMFGDTQMLGGDNTTGDFTTGQTDYVHDTTSMNLNDFLYLANVRFPETAATRASSIGMRVPIDETDSEGEEADASRATEESILRRAQLVPERDLYVQVNEMVRSRTSAVINELKGIEDAMKESNPAIFRMLRDGDASATRQLKRDLKQLKSVAARREKANIYLWRNKFIAEPFGQKLADAIVAMEGEKQAMQAMADDIARAQEYLNHLAQAQAPKSEAAGVLDEKQLLSVLNFAESTASLKESLLALNAVTGWELYELSAQQIIVRLNGRYEFVAQTGAPRIADASSRPILGHSFGLVSGEDAVPRDSEAARELEAMLLDDIAFHRQLGQLTSTIDFASTLNDVAIFAGRVDDIVSEVQALCNHGWSLHVSSVDNDAIVRVDFSVPRLNTKFFVFLSFTPTSYPHSITWRFESLFGDGISAGQVSAAVRSVPEHAFGRLTLICQAIQGLLPV